MSAPPNISVIIPAFRAAATIGRAFSSIAAQTTPPREVVVVDDGSDDHTADAAAKFSPRFEAAGIILKIFRQANLGPSAARNRAIRESSGTWLAFLDADDEWLPTKVERSLAIAAGTGANFVAHDFLISNNSREDRADCARHCPPGTDPFLAQLLRGFIATSTVVVRRDLIVRAGGFDPGLRSGQDYDLWLAVLTLPGINFRIFPEALSRYHVTANSISTRVDMRRQAALTILARHRESLRGRVQSPAWTTTLRVLIIHAQAALMHAKQGHVGAALVDALRIPASLIMTLSLPNAVGRTNYLAQQ